MDDFERATERVIGGLPKNHGKMGHQEVPHESVTCRISKKMCYESIRRNETMILMRKFITLYFLYILVMKCGNECKYVYAQLWKNKMGSISFALCFIHIP